MITPIKLDHAKVAEEYYAYCKKNGIRPLKWKEWMDDMLERTPLFSANPVYGLKFAYGYINGDNRQPMIVTVMIDGVVHTAILGGTGGGKSVLVNTILVTVGLANRPDQVEIRYLDYKVNEAFKYSRSEYHFPHMRLAAGISDVNYGISVLKYLVEEMNKRLLLMGTVTATNVADYYEKTGVVIPTLLTVIDEVAAMQNKATSKQNKIIDEYLELLGTQGRAAAVLVVFATQVKPNWDSKFMSHFGHRICTRVSETSISQSLINSDLPTLLDVGYVYAGEKRFGDKYIQKVRVPFMTPKDFDYMMQFLAEKAKPYGTFVIEEYNESLLREMPPHWLDQAIAERETFVLGDKGYYDPSCEFATFKFTDVLGGNMLITSSKEDVLDRLKSVMLQNFTAKNAMIAVICSSIQEVEKYDLLNPQIRDITNNINESTGIATIRRVITERMFMKNIANWAMLNKKKSVTDVEVAEMSDKLDMTATIFTIPTFFEVRNGVKLFVDTPFLETLKHYTKRINEIITLRGNFNDIYVIVDGFQDIKGFGVECKLDYSSWFQSAPTVGVKFVLIGTILGDLKTVVKKMFAFVLASNIVESVAFSLDLDGVQLMGETLGALCSVSRDLNIVFKLQPPQEYAGR